MTGRCCCCVQAAIKMLTKVVEKQSPGSLSQHLGDMMPGLLKAYDNVESSVRKAAVFCIVALHQLVGEATLQVRTFPRSFQKPDPHVFGPLGSESIYHPIIKQKIVRKTLIPTVL
jgi:hypothetical protein